jgi:hypothetical protein
MKKFFYVLLVVFSSAVTITSCTEEVVDPKSETDGGGAGNDGKL